jgi:hypothetical protein
MAENRRKNNGAASHHAVKQLFDWMDKRRLELHAWAQIRGSTGQDPLAVNSTGNLKCSLWKLNTRMYFNAHQRFSEAMAETAAVRRRNLQLEYRFESFVAGQAAA